MNISSIGRVVEIDETARPARPIVLHLDLLGLEPGLARAVLDVGERAGILGGFRHAGEMQIRPLPITFQPSISRSCSELNWSAFSGMILRAIACSSHFHWNTPVSNAAVGVSALYSSSLAGPLPS